MACVEVLSICVNGVAGVVGSTALDPAFASEAPARLATGATTATSVIEPHESQSGHLPTHLGTTDWHSEQR
ncbi:hypothetical protein GCM10020255_049920 [Rhodococcus baikonurensis]